MILTFNEFFSIYYLLILQPPLSFQPMHGDYNSNKKSTLPEVASIQVTHFFLSVGFIEELFKVIFLCLFHTCKNLNSCRGSFPLLGIMIKKKTT